MFKKHLQIGVASVALVAFAGGPAYAAKPTSDTTAAETETDLTLESDTVVRIDPSYGNLDAFYGNLDAFYGNLDAFYGNLDAFYGNLDAFWGNLDAFYGNLDAFYGNLDAFYGNLDAFWGNLDAFYGNLDAFDGGAIQSDLGALFKQAEYSFGDAVTSTTGLSFDAAVTAPLLKKYGVNAADFSGAENLTRDQYGALLLELHDCMMSFSGRDQIDHWMGTVNWSPALSQEALGGRGVVVGILDTLVEQSDMLTSRPRHSWGYSVDGQNHGAAVASIIGAAHDDAGAMGIAPGVATTFYNPFDESFTTNWDDVKFGINSLGSANASVINMSLGVSGWTLHQEWANVFSDAKVEWFAQDVVFVKAAGNDGVVQTTDIEWGALETHNRLLIVGSVDPSGEISSFSNRPGDACLLVNGVCNPDNLLMNRFLVAPGELILVANNDGGVTRASGTSFAAPMVSGAIALTQSRWRWLANHPVETSEIILRSAKDLGDPGVDRTYGWGLLDIEASQAPLDMNALMVMNEDGDRIPLSTAALDLQAQYLIDPDAAITVFEDIGATYRDFVVPLSSLETQISDASVAIDSTTEIYLSRNLETSFADDQGDTMTTTSEGRGRGKKKRAAFNAGLAYHTISLGDAYSPWTASFTANRRNRRDIVATDAVPFQIGAELVNQNNGLTLLFGEGQSALAFVGGGSQFNRLSDHNIATGGVNPLLGLASGGVYGGVSLPLDERLSISFGASQNNDKHQSLNPATGEIRNDFVDLDAYQATAVMLDMDYAITQEANFGVSFTHLNEATGFLGGQGVGALSFDGGALTTAVTLSGDASFGPGIALSASMTGGKTQATGFNNSVLSIAEGGVYSTSFEIVATKYGVLSETDHMRLSFAQPLHIENDGLAMTTMQVIDRTSGELGLVSNGIQGAERRFVSELLYAANIADGRATLGVFGQVELNRPGLAGDATAISGGARLDFKF